MKKKLLLGALIVCTQISKAQWVQGGNMSGLSAWSMCTKGSDIWAGTNYGTYKSTDNGVNFNVAKTGIPSTMTVFGMVSSGSYLFAAGAYSGLYISSDNGASWSTSSNSLTTLGVTALTVNGGTVFAGTTGGVFISTDNGSNWTVASTGLTNSNVRSLAVNGSTLYAGTNAGPFSSTDNGASWTSNNAGIPNAEVNTIAFDGGNIYIGTDNGGDVFVSNNGGSTWTSITNTLSCNEVNSLIVSGGVILAATDAGFVTSNNNGATWIFNSTGLVNSTVKSLLVSGSNIYAGVINGGVHKRALSDFGISAGVKENKSAIDFKLFPNPTQGKMEISTGKWYNEKMEVTVYNLVGENVFSSHLQSPESVIHLTGISKGVYFIQLNDGTYSAIKKIIVE